MSKTGRKVGRFEYFLGGRKSGRFSENWGRFCQNISGNTDCFLKETFIVAECIFTLCWTNHLKLTRMSKAD